MILDPVASLGAFVGVVAICISIWLQMIAPRKCPPRYVLAYLLFGSFLLLINLDAFTVDNTSATVVGVLAFLTALVIEVVMGVLVYRRKSVERLTDYDRIERAVERLLGP